MPSRFDKRPRKPRPDGRREGDPQGGGAPQGGVRHGGGRRPESAPRQGTDQRGGGGRRPEAAPRPDQGGGRRGEQHQRPGSGRVAEQGHARSDGQASRPSRPEGSGRGGHEIVHGTPRGELGFRRQTDAGREHGVDRAPAAATAWERQAGWYDRHQGAGGDDFYQELVLPAVWRHLKVVAGRTVLDVGCGQGVVGRHLAGRQVASLGVDASPSLIESAQGRASPLERYVVGDATRLDGVIGDKQFDGATAVLALQDIDPLEPLFSGVAMAVKPGSRFVIVTTHPCFRIPKRSGWGFDEADGGVQYRRVEAYLTPVRLPIITHPGRPDDGSRTWSFHRPVSAYINALGDAGFGIVSAEELCSHRRGSQGRRSAAEEAALREIPLFLVLVAVRR